MGKYIQSKAPNRKKTDPVRREDSGLAAYDKQRGTAEDWKYLELKGPDGAATSIATGQGPRPIVKANGRARQGRSAPPCRSLRRAVEPIA